MTRDIISKGPQHHSPAYAKLCGEVGVAPPPSANMHRPGPNSPSPQRDARTSSGLPLPSGQIHFPSQHPGVPFQFPSFGSPISPHLGSVAPFAPSQVRPGMPAYPSDLRDGKSSYGSPVMAPPASYPGPANADRQYPHHAGMPFAEKQGMPVGNTRASPNGGPAPIIPSLLGGPPNASYDQYLQNIAALQSKPGPVCSTTLQSSSAHAPLSIAHLAHLQCRDSLASHPIKARRVLQEPGNTAPDRPSAGRVSHPASLHTRRLDPYITITNLIRCLARPRDHGAAAGSRSRQTARLSHCIALHHTASTGPPTCSLSER